MRTFVLIKMIFLHSLLWWAAKFLIGNPIVTDNINYNSP